MGASVVVMWSAAGSSGAVTSGTMAAALVAPSSPGVWTGVCARRSASFLATASSFSLCRLSCSSTASCFTAHSKNCVQDHRATAVGCMATERNDAGLCGTRILPFHRSTSPCCSAIDLARRASSWAHVAFVSCACARYFSFNIAPAASASARSFSAARAAAPASAHVFLHTPGCSSEPSQQSAHNNACVCYAP